MVCVEAHLQGLGVTCLLERDRRNDRDVRDVKRGNVFGEKPVKKRTERLRKPVKKVR